MWWIAVAHAQGYQEQAEELMQLDFDLSEVESRVTRKAMQPAPAAAPTAYDDYGQPYPSPVPPRAPLPLEPNSVLRAVTVHRDRALVTRVQELQLGAGAAAVTFEGLPYGIGAQGLTAAVETGGARIVGVEVLSGSGEVRDDARTEAVRVEAEKLVDELGAVRDHIESLLAEREFLRAALIPAGATAALPVTQAAQALQFVAATERRISKDLREQQDEAEELAEKLEPLLIKLDDPLATGQPVRIELEVDRAGPVTVALEYTVSGAGWAPSYSARLDPADDRVELQVFGVVTQSTGEDWTNAEISLSTADPTGRGTVPELVPWTLGRSGGVGVYGAIDVGATTDAPTPTGTGGVVSSDMTAKIEGRGAVVLHIDGKRTIRGDGSPQRLPVGTQELQATVEFTAIPKMAPEVRRRATVRYDGELPLLPGPTSSFVGKDYVGAGDIGAIVPGETLELAFGTDDRFRVTRQLVTRQQERIGRKSTRYTFRFRTVVANHGATAERVALQDQLPLAEDTRIEVRPIDLGDGAVDPEDQRITWALDVPAHGEVSIELAFSITVPDELSYVASDFESLF